MATTTHFNLPKPDASKDVDEEFYQLQSTLDLLDSILKTLQDAVNAKAASSHTHAISDVVNLATALAAKMPASQTFALDDLTDVGGAAGAPNGYVLVKSALGWLPSSSLAALGAHGHLISEITGLVDALGAKAEATSVVRHDIAQTLTALQQAQARANIDGGLLGDFRNKLLNGAFLVTEAGAAGTIAAGLTSYICDQWLITNSTNQTLTWSVASTQGYARNRPENRLAISFATAPTSGGVTLIQRIEDVRTLAGKSVTTAFDVLDGSSIIIGTTVTSNFEQYFGVGGSTITYAGGVSQLVAGAGRIILPHAIPTVAGKTVNAGSWLAPRITFEPRSIGFFIIAAVQLEEGSVATRFEERNIAQERLMCARYFYRGVSSFMDGNATVAGHYVVSPVLFPVPMRATPTPSFSVSGSSNISGAQTGVYAASALGGTYQIHSAAAGRFYTVFAAPTFDARL